MKITRSQLKEIIREEIQLFSERYSGFRDSWRGVTKRDAIELAKKNNLKFVQDKKHTQYWWAFRPGAKQAIFKWDEEGNELISDYSPMELRMGRINEDMLEEATFVFSYGEGSDKFLHQLKAFRLKDAFEQFVRMYKIPKSNWKKISVKKSGGLFGSGKNKGWHTYEP